MSFFTSYFFIAHRKALLFYSFRRIFDVTSSSMRKEKAIKKLSVFFSSTNFCFSGGYTLII